jgi:putative transcriptional regulator
LQLKHLKKGKVMKDHDLILAMEEVLADAQNEKNLSVRPLLYPDIKDLRERFHLSQQQFAQLFCVSLKTLQQWEQGRRHPQGPAKVLLNVIAKNPQAVLDTLH